MDHPVIAIVGCGFIGSHLAEELPKLFFSQDLFPYKFRFIDFDKWEDRNAANQNVDWKTAQAEEFKAITCAEAASRYPNLEVEAVTEKLTPGNSGELLKDTVLVIDAVDNIPTRQLMWGLGKGGATGPVMHTGISRKGDGMVNWSSPTFDTFPFAPNNVAGRNLAQQDFREPPCEMYKYRSSGMILFQAIARATAFYFGKDPWEMLGGHSEQGTMTCWTSNEKGMQLQVDDIYLQGDFFPIHRNA